MIRYIPHFILEQHASGNTCGTRQGFLLMLDIAQFSKLIRELHRIGHQGADELHILLNSSLGKAVDIIDSHGGIIAFFAGDAVCAIFPDTAAKNVVSAVNGLCLYFREPVPTQNHLSGMKLQVRVVVGFGSIAWDIFPNPIQHEYLFSSELFEEMDRLFAARMPVLYSAQAAAKIGKRYFEKHDAGYVHIHKPAKGAIVDAVSPKSNIAKDDFICRELKNCNPDNEIRSAAICFIMLDKSVEGFKAMPLVNLEQLATQYGGYLNKLLPIGKGVAAMLLFGVPQSSGKSLDRAAKFALEAIKKMPQAAIGIACGTVYAGYTCTGEITEYTAYGSSVNMAVRLMEKALPGNILTDNTMYLELHGRYQMQEMGKLASRTAGKDALYFRLGKPVKASLSVSESSFVGREEELKDLKQIMQQTFLAKQNAIIYISGDPGIGKTRLARELVAQYQHDAGFYFVTCEEILQSPLDAIKQLVHQEFKVDVQSFDKSDLACFRKAWQEFAGDNEKLMQHESVIASLVNLDWADSFWSKLPSEVREMHLKSAINDFLQRLCETKSVMILLDDGQWLDEDSKAILRDFSAEGKGKMVIISPCRYLQDGSKVDLQLEKHPRYDLELGSLDQNGSYALIQEIVKIRMLPPETISAIHAQAMGNPLFIEQISYYLMEHKLLGSTGVITGISTVTRNFQINDIISGRIDKLDEEFRACLHNAAVLGVEFSIVVLSHMLQRDISGDLQKGTLMRFWKMQGNISYAFTHVLIRDACYQRMMGARLKKLHQLAGEAIAEVHTDRIVDYAEVIALHYQQADMPQLAAKYYDMAGDDHWETCNYKRSEKNYHKALSLLEQHSGTDTPEYSEVLFHLGLLYHYLLEHQTAEAIYLQVLEFQEKHRGKDNPGLSPYLNNLGRLYKDMGRFAESEKLLNKSLQIEITNHPTSSNVADRMNNIGHLYTKMNEPAKALPYYQQAVKLMGEAYSFHPYYGGFISNLASTYLELGNLDEAEPLLVKGLKYTTKAYGEKHPATANQLSAQGRLWMLRHKYRAAEKNYLQALAIYNTFFGPAHTRTKATLQALAEIYLLLGKPRLAKTYRELLAKVN